MTVNEPGTGRPIVKHTPGPWEPYGFRTGIIGVRSATGAIARITIADNSIHRERGWANAGLIAAAPTMFTYIAERAAAGDARAKEILEAINAGCHRQYHHSFTP